MENKDRYNKLYVRLMQAESIVISTHRGPDADGLGAEIALFEMLSSLKRQVRILNQDPIPEKIRFVDPGNRVQHLNKGEEAPHLDSCTVVSLDNSDPARLGPVQALIKADRSNLIIVDHHDAIESDENIFFEFPDISSTSEIVFELFQLSGQLMPLEVAMAVYTGIVSDTGSFQYRKTSSRTHEIASMLLKIGVRPESVAERLNFSSPVGRLSLKKLLYERLSFDSEQLIAYFTISYRDLQELNLTFDDLEGVVNELIEPSQIRIGILFSEREPGITKVSVRSKGDDDVVPVISRLGGGGHKNAAGATVHMSLLETVDQVVPAFRAIL